MNLLIGKNLQQLHFLVFSVHQFSNQARIIRLNKILPLGAKSMTTLLKKHQHKKLSINTLVNDLHPVVIAKFEFENLSKSIKTVLFSPYHDSYTQR